MANILVDEGQIAGIGDWATTGWDNFEVPWNPGPEYEGVAPMTSVAGATATFTLHEARNAGGFQTRAGSRTAPVGDGNGDLMDVAAWGTWENDDTQIFDMSVSEIPFSTYDVIVYMNIHGSAGGSGTGVITLNGSPTELVVMNFDGTIFTEIVNNGDTGNYIVYKNVKGASFSLQLWGDGANHLGVCGFQVREAAPERASSPSPENEATDVLRESILSWNPGQFAAKHDLYLGESLDDVASGTVPTAAGLTDTSFDPGRLTLGQTYYWRVDEVNGTPDQTVFKGELWSFQVEPYSIPVAGDTIIVSASSVSNEFSTAEQAINGAGLDANGVHGMEPGTMWFTASVDVDPWIEFEFDGVKSLDMMKVWNANSAAESAIGWSVKDVITEVSVDGVTWDVLPEASQFSRGPGSPEYAQPDMIDLGGAAAKYLRLDIESNWGGLIMSYGLSEVQFFEIPVQARTPDPADGSIDIAPNAVITWRPGRNAAQHDVYVDTDVNAVAEGTAASVTTQTASLDLASMDLELGRTYYWRVDEVNDAEVPSAWASDVWSFTTVEALVVDNFEGYSNSSPTRPFQSWLDGIGYSADEFFPVAYGGNGTGAAIGHDIWSLSSPYFDGFIMETDRTIAGSRKSMPFYYANTGGVAAETQRTFATPQDWTVGGVQLLNISFFGEAENTGTLYAKINGTKVTYTLEPAHIAAQSWKTWNIDLAELGINLQSITTMAIGVEGSSASGMLLIDDIVLRSVSSDTGETESLVNNFDLLPVGSNMHDVPGWEGWFGDAQGGARVTDTVAYSGTNSLEIVGTRDDLVPNWPRVESGVYVSSVMQYVPTGTDGSMYFGLLSDYGVNGDKLARLGTVLSNCTTGMVYVNDLAAGTRTETPLLRDQWVQIRIVMNVGGNACDFFYGDVLLGSLECPSAGGYDIWPDDDVDVVYYDDFRFQS
ncbi:MAG: discoidin domain-containing protein, partial [Planctomycetes bacterium]|nr:discoidin domain-containing protein [Planctomycetota bacterium]